METTKKIPATGVLNIKHQNQETSENDCDSTEEEEPRNIIGGIYRAPQRWEVTFHHEPCQDFFALNLNTLGPWWGKIWLGRPESSGTSLI
jgi:hypothetical protein